MSDPRADAPSATDRLLAARRELIETSSRTRLLSAKFDGSSSVHIVNERCDEVFRILHMEGRTMTVAAAPEAISGDAEPLEPSTSTTVADDAPAPHQIDAILQSDLPREALERRLRRMQYEARSQSDEQGFSTLHLAIGFLEWRERDAETSRDDTGRHAPLLLIPVELERSRAGASFRIASTGDGITENLSLVERLRGAFGIELPSIDLDAEGVLPSAWFRRIAEVVRDRRGWNVRPDAMLLGFFSFARLLMYRDLDPECWPPERRPGEHPVLRGLLDGAMPPQPASAVDDDAFVDDVLPPEKCLHVVDADSSQATAIADVVHARRSIVVQGPPGTGKSQTIANIIVGAAAEGRRVLFVAEKRAALEVVKRRLDAIGLGPLCLELHSAKANRRSVLRELGDTLELGRPRTPDLESQREQLRTVQGALNAHAAHLHAVDPGTGLSLHEIVGRLARLEASGRRSVSRDQPDEPDQPGDSVSSTPQPGTDQPIRWLAYDLVGDDTWSPAAFAARRDALAALASRVERTGTPVAHPFRGVGIESILPHEIDDVARRAAMVDAALARLEVHAAALETAAAEVTATERGRGEPDRSIEGMRQILAAFIHVRSMRAPEALPLDATTWSARRAAIDELIVAQREARRLDGELRPLLAPGAERLDVAGIRATLAASGGSPFRWLSPAWWAARRAVRGLVTSAPPTNLETRLELLDRILGLQDARRRMEAWERGEASLGRDGFGVLWSGESSDPERLRSVVDFVDGGLRAALPPWFMRLRPEAIAAVDLDGAVAAVEEAGAAIEALADELRLDAKEAFNATTIGAVPTTALRARLRAWQESPRRIDEWIDLRRRLMSTAAEGAGPVARALAIGELAPTDAVSQFEHAFLARQLRRLDPEGGLLRFDGEDHEALRRRFIELDRERIALSRAEVALRHFDRLPRPEETMGQMGLIRREIQKKARHLPLRRLLDEAGESIQRIKPVFMMSPLSVAQFLAPSGVQFDLLVFDEASQVRPVEALGAVARLRRDGQLVVVGDQRQLPPTAFFRFESDEPDGSDDDDGALRDIESILGVAVSAGLPARMLRWHYRSEHHSLIAVSNRLFYDDRLHVVPSPFDRGPRHGLWFEHIQGTLFERGAGAVNRGEAKAVAEAVMAHARAQPEWTLGVGAFSIRQRDVILDELETLRRAEPELESFFAEDGPEPFFVKNLENVQGDERDVIFISVGYGRDADGRLTMNFGPVSRDGGERRLNVLATRAKRRCVVFSSITDDEISLERATGTGAAALKAFLRYARLGLLEGEAEASAAESGTVERDIAEAIGAAGWPAERRIGVGGFRVDIAVRDPGRVPNGAHPGDSGRFILGVETDGLAYRDARSARDRERTRPSVLEARGWTLHRLYAAEWFRGREVASRSMFAAIRQCARSAELGAEKDTGSPVVVGAERATADADPASVAVEGASPAAANESASAEASTADMKSGSELASEGHTAGHSGTRAGDAPPIERDEPIEAADALTAPYVMARVRVPAKTPPDEVAGERLREIVTEIVDREGPLHEDELERRMVALWGMRRTTKAIQSALHSGLTLALLAKRIERSGAFLDRPEATRATDPRPPRRRSGVDSTTLRRPEMLPPAEIRALLQLIVTRHFGITREELVLETRRQLGFGATSAALRELIEAQLDDLVATGVLAGRGGGYGVAEER